MKFILWMAQCHNPMSPAQGPQDCQARASDPPHSICLPVGLFPPDPHRRDGQPCSSSLVKNWTTTFVLRFPQEWWFLLAGTPQMIKCLVTLVPPPGRMILAWSLDHHAQQRPLWVVERSGGKACHTGARLLLPQALLTAWTPGIWGSSRPSSQGPDPVHRGPGGSGTQVVLGVVTSDPSRKARGCPLWPCGPVICREGSRGSHEQGAGSWRRPPVTDGTKYETTRSSSRKREIRVRCQWGDEWSSR